MGRYRSVVTAACRPYLASVRAMWVELPPKYLAA